MFRYKKSLTSVLVFLLASTVFGQSQFSLDAYKQFLQQNQNLTAAELLQQHQPETPYFKDNTTTQNVYDYAYLDSIEIKFGLTADEKEHLRRDHFVATERLSFDSYGHALHSVYAHDLPVFITTDIILQALHMSYDKILMELELQILLPELKQASEKLYTTYPQLLAQYQSNPELNDALKDVDLYITIVKSLLQEAQAAPQFTSVEQVSSVWEAIQAEQFTAMKLFADRNRKLDFSQFTPRGHYTREINGDKPLIPYFKAMMWLGRIDFLLTAPPENPWEPDWTPEQLLRMNLGALLLNELLDLSGAREHLDVIDSYITFMVGESDNLTPAELKETIAAQGIDSPADLLDSATYDNFRNALQEIPGAQQNILSSVFLMNPYDPKPGVLPVSYRLSGQRFIIDSYVFSNVVYDRIVFQNQKIWRPMPDPLDAMFVLGNENALPLLKDKVEKYKYASQLASLRYLVDSYDNDFWQQSLYNAWLSAIRELNPGASNTSFPFFMQTAAWQQQKLNTQLSSWAQLRHDNLLYAKQSYTGGTACSYPYSFVEPYPDFYRKIETFADEAIHNFSNAPQQSGDLEYIISYFEGLRGVMDTLATIADKELQQQPINQDEIDFLQSMLFQNGGSGKPPFSGWYASLFYDVWDASASDYVVADVHTQPTDAAGNVVGRVLHVGVGKVNLGIVLAPSPVDARPMAFVGAMMSYHEKITEQFKRHTDEEWEEMAFNHNLPQRPDWVNIYLTDAQGNSLAKGRELPGTIYTSVAQEQPQAPKDFSLLQNYPNPFNPSTTFKFEIPNSGFVSLKVYDLLGREVAVLVNDNMPAGRHEVSWNAENMATGLYLVRLQTDKLSQVKKVIFQK